MSRLTNAVGILTGTHDGDRYGSLLVAYLGERSILAGQQLDVEIEGDTLSLETTEPSDQ